MQKLSLNTKFEAHNNGAMQTWELTTAESFKQKCIAWVWLQTVDTWQIKLYIRDIKTCPEWNDSAKNDFVEKKGAVPSYLKVKLTYYDPVCQ